MKITAIDTYIAGNPWKNWLFAKVSTDEGIYGVGEGTLNYFAKTIEAAIHELSRWCMGMDPFQVEIISQRLIRDVYSEGAQIHMCAVAAIEIACWDIIGKACNQPDLQSVGRPLPREAARLRQRLVSRSAHARELRREGQEGGRRAATPPSSSTPSAAPGAISRATISISRWTSSAPCATPSGDRSTC